MDRYQINDAGRDKSARPKQRMDCVVWAIAIAVGREYDHVYDWLAKHGRKSGRSTPKNVWQPLLDAYRGMRKHSFPAVTGRPRMNLRRFCEQHPHGKYVVQCAKHVLAVIDGV